MYGQYISFKTFLLRRNQLKPLRNRCLSIKRLQWAIGAVLIDYNVLLSCHFKELNLVVFFQENMSSSEYALKYSSLTPDFFRGAHFLLQKQ